MFGRGCQFRHQNLKPAGMYKRDKYGQIARHKDGERILLQEEDTWACPYCRLLFLKPNRKIRREVEKKHGKLNNRTNPKILRRHPNNHTRTVK